MSLSDLPAELLEHICGYLDSCSLQNVSLVNSRCRSVAAPALFEAISIESHQAPEFVQLLQKSSHVQFNHVRILEIRSGLPSTIHYEQETFPDQDFIALFEADGFERSWHVRANDSSWLPVLELLEKFSAIIDLIWTCKQQFPPSLLRHLQDQLPSSRLHLRTFQLRSLVKGFEETTDPHELMLVQSHNLHSIWFRYDIAHTWNNDHQIPEAVSRTIQGLALNLREVRLFEKIMGAEPDYSEYANLVRTLESATSELSHQQGRLESLHFAGTQYLITRKIEKWNRCTDFNVLKNLTLDCFVNPAALVQLAACTFSSLAVLELSLVNNNSVMSPYDKSSGPAQEFLCSIPSLEALKISGEMDHNRLRDVIVHHGMTLQSLSLEPMGYSRSRLSLTLEDVSWIADHCPELVNLRLTTHRSKGDNVEAAAYSSIGRIRRLQSLNLTLDASDYTSLRYRSDNSEGYLAKAKDNFNDFGKRSAHIEDECDAPSDPRIGHFLDMFINAALDERLAWSIHSKIIDARPPGAFILDTVELQSDGCGDFGPAFVPPMVAKVASEIQHRWLFKREYGFNANPESFAVKELQHTNRLPTADESIVGTIEEEEADENTASENELDFRIESIFRHLWPFKAGNSPWQSDWHSFELSD